ncbi:MAG: TonB-dependent receptor [Bacteroidales bacterium]|nr:TonB-dependent receptor [Bacteroidales bacterium]MCF8405794.1 TonB-dependent receptor [Bacteroidales bacterium]
MVKKYFFFILFGFFTIHLAGQDILVKGFVKTINEQGNKVPLPSANVYWQESTMGTVSDASGYFEIKGNLQNQNRLVVSYVGYISDTIVVVESSGLLEIYLEAGSQLDDFVVKGKRDAHALSAISPLNTEMISSDGLQRLACCSLAESFETSATVDVGYTDAVSGAKQIQMLGLAGIYSQILTENQPTLRLLASTYGLNYVPGPWLHSISISKGTSSVMAGYESITGQINIDLKKPEGDEKLYLDLFANEHQRVEFNANSSFNVNEKLKSVVLLHASGLENKVDNNGDGFLDLPTGKLLMLSNRYFFNHDNKIKSRFGFELLNEDRVGGQTAYDPEKNSDINPYYGIDILSSRFTLFENTGILLDSENNGSLGINANFVYHSMDAMFGLRKYDATQNSFNLRTLYQTNLSNNHHKLVSGLSLVLDNLEEKLTDTTLNRNELVVGAYSEYTYSSDKFTVITGIRGDHHNDHGFFFVPRVHIKYQLSETSSVRFSAGRGIRSAFVLPENIGLMASSRRFIFKEDFKLERAWNFGGNFIQKFKLDEQRNFTLNVDFYRTIFQNQIVIDVNKEPTNVYFYNLKGKSWSNSFQTDLILDLFKGFEMTLAYRYSDVKVTMDEALIRKPLSSPHKGLVSLHYSSKYEKWNFTFTTQFNGESNLPDTKGNPVAYQLDETSPAYIIIHAQILRKFRQWEVYFGAENLTNYKQTNPILSSDDPFGDYFDSSMIWGPVIGRSINAGIRFIID